MTNTLDWMMDAFSGDPSPETLNVTKFGNFTASYERLPPAIPPEYMATLFTVVITAFIGSWLTPTFVAWRKAKSDARQINYYHKRIASLENDGIGSHSYFLLNMYREHHVLFYLMVQYHFHLVYENLRNEISILFEKIYRKSINSLYSSSDKTTKEKQIDKIKNEIEYAYSEGKITELHYNLLNKKITDYEGNSHDTNSSRIK